MDKLKIVTVIIMFVLLLGAGIGSSTSIPSNAKVYANDSKKIYIGIPSVSKAESLHLRLTTISDVYNHKYQPDEKSRDNGDFIQEGRSLSGGLLEKVGILSPLKSRWNKDGSWNW